MANVSEVLERVEDMYSVRRVYGDPIEREGVTVIPAAKVSGGGGGGEGTGPAGDGHEGEGSGMGFGMRARPAGAWVISHGESTWQPAIDVNRMLLGAYLVAIAYIVFAWLAPSRKQGPR